MALDTALNTIIPLQNKYVFGDILESACLSVRPSVCPSVYNKKLISVKTLAGVLSYI